MSEELTQEDQQIESAPVDSSEPSVEVSQASSEQATPEVVAQAPESVWDAFKSLPDFEGQDDRAIAQRLYDALQREQEAQQAIDRYQQVLPITREYLTHRDKFQAYMSEASRPQPQQPAPPPVAEEPEQPKWWNPPQVRDSYKRYLVRDESGREVIAQDAPLEAKHELFEYQQYKAEFAQKFLADPESALGPMVEQIAQQKAREIVDNQFTDYGNQQYVSTLEEENRDWLFTEDGQPSQEGIAVQRYIAQAAQLGIQNPQARWEYATDKLSLDLHNQIREQRNAPPQRPAVDFSGLLNSMSPQPQQQAAATQVSPAQNQAEKDIEYLRREASRNPSRASSAPDPRIPSSKVSFQDRLAATLAKNGLA